MINKSVYNDKKKSKNYIVISSRNKNNKNYDDMNFEIQDEVDKYINDKMNVKHNRSSVTTIRTSDERTITCDGIFDKLTFHYISGYSCYSNPCEIVYIYSNVKKLTSTTTTTTTSCWYYVGITPIANPCFNDNYIGETIFITDNQKDIILLL
ncbi:hypothetical protein BCR32DRAFT_283671 [Anaeromyces robustus]|uniref:Uncharacterized protein n=1 Tax=Anaeromyces robustus TaxID=1754192 RepID=A0A1Y1WTP7_9FUNG|nr:hypothetical protein BCR32DRAFT_283671 [Anaeromyces robustus]|eukprot:ORX76907.1 hypothetical protein BCR32DRAFT_283671 [Anaeromyces robustus]